MKKEYLLRARPRLLGRVGGGTVEEEEVERVGEGTVEEVEVEVKKLGKASVGMVSLLSDFFVSARSYYANGC
jgi:hypothetical protein